MTEKAMTNRWEVFCDPRMYEHYGVREVGETRRGHCFHCFTYEQCETLRDLLDINGASFSQIAEKRILKS